MSKVFINEHLTAMDKSAVWTVTSHENHAAWAFVLCDGSWFGTVASGCPRKVQGHLCSRLFIDRTQKTIKKFTVPALSAGKAIWIETFGASGSLFCVQSSPTPLWGSRCCPGVAELQACAHCCAFSQVSSIQSLWLYCSCLSQCKSKTWCNLLHLWKESVESNHMRQIAFYVLLARQQRTLPVTCTTFLMLVSVLMARPNCSDHSSSKWLFV